MLGTIPGGMLCRRGLSRTVFFATPFSFRRTSLRLALHMGNGHFRNGRFPCAKLRHFRHIRKCLNAFSLAPGRVSGKAAARKGGKARHIFFPAMKAARKQAVSPQSGPDCFRAIGVLFPKGFCWGFSARRKIFALGAKISCYKFVTIRLNLLFLYPESNEECESLTGRRGGKVSPFLPLKEVKTILSTYY